MGRKSTKENKNVYQTSRESLGLTREAAAEKLEFLSADRIEKIESEKSLPHPDAPRIGRQLLLQERRLLCNRKNTLPLLLCTP